MITILTLVITTLTLTLTVTTLTLTLTAVTVPQIEAVQQKKGISFEEAKVGNLQDT